MRIFTVNLVVAACHLIAGCLAVLAVQHNGSLLSLGLVGLAFILPISSMVWQYTKYGSALQQLDVTLASPNLNKLVRTGFQELDELAGELNLRLLDSKLAVSAEVSGQRLEAELSQQFNQIDALLNEFEKAHEFGMDVGENLAVRVKSALNASERQTVNTMQQALACSREIGKGTQQLIACADDQSDSIHRITDVVEGLSAQLLQLGDNAGATVELSSNVRQFAAAGLTDVQSVGKDLESIRNQTSTRERKLHLLNQQAREISGIVDVVGHLSSKTDLLALNASIESVRAGEHGRGFALVAEEVRSLATQSAQSVSDISAKVERMLQETEESLAAVSGEQEQLQRLLESVNHTLKLMQQIDSSSVDCEVKANEMTGVTQQQINQLMEIVRELETSSEVSKANRMQAEGIHWTAKSLAQLGESVGFATMPMSNNSTNFPNPKIGVPSNV